MAWAMSVRHTVANGYMSGFDRMAVAAATAAVTVDIEADTVVVEGHMAVVDCMLEADHMLETGHRPELGYRAEAVDSSVAGCTGDTVDTAVATHHIGAGYMIAVLGTDLAGFDTGEDWSHIEDLVGWVDRSCY